MPAVILGKSVQPADNRPGSDHLSSPYACLNELGQLSSMETPTPASFSTSTKRGEVNWLPWSVLKISGGP